MSHFDCAVLLPPVEGTVEGAEALERAMAPYKEYLGDEGGGEYLEFVEDEECEVDEGLRDWVDHYRERYLDPYVDHTIVIVDCHI